MSATKKPKTASGTPSPSASQSPASSPSAGGIDTFGSYPDVGPSLGSGANPAMEGAEIRRDDPSTISHPGPGSGANPAMASGGGSSSSTAIPVSGDTAPVTPPQYTPGTVPWLFHQMDVRSVQRFDLDDMFPEFRTVPPGYAVSYAYYVKLGGRSCAVCAKYLYQPDPTIPDFPTFARAETQEGRSLAAIRTLFLIGIWCQQPNAVTWLATFVLNKYNTKCCKYNIYTLWRP
jgi:hypothetical protein